MSIYDLWQYWKQFWFSSESPLSICLFRIIYGLIVLEYCLLLSPELMNWFGVQGICSPQTSKQFFALIGPTGLNILNWLPPGDTSVTVVFYFLVIAAIGLTIGLFTRVSALCVFLALLSLEQRNGLIMSGGEILLKMSAFYLIFAPCAYCLSLDSLLKKKIHLPAQLDPSGWPQRLFRFFIAFIYFEAFWLKLGDKTWCDGSAVYYVLREQEFLRFAVPWIANNLSLCHALTWGTLIVEGSMWTLVWFKKTRYLVLVSALILHIGIEYTLNLPIFESLMIASLLVFVPAEDIKKAYDTLNDKLLRKFFKPRRNASPSCK